MVGHGTERMMRIPAEQFCKTLCLVTESDFHGHCPYIGIYPYIGISHALTPAQGLERGRDGGEEKVMTVTRA
jgi:hypothetical protein